MNLGVNLDHVATLRQQRREDEPCLISATHAALAGGADSITIHLREDRRHIQDKDLGNLRQIAPHLNLEMAATDDMLAIARQHLPNNCCLVPEKRHELTTEGGLDLLTQERYLSSFVSQLRKDNMSVSLFIDPDLSQVRAAAKLGATCVELHTGNYAKSYPDAREPALARLREAAQLAKTLGLEVHAGHGIKYYNVSPLLDISEWSMFNIGHSIISRAVFVGLTTAVAEMKALLRHTPAPAL